MNDDIISRSALKKVINEYIDEDSELDNEGNHCEKWCAMKEAEMAIDDAQPIETTIENLISTLSVESLKATTWFKVETPSGDAVRFRREKTGHWLYRHYNWWCSECGEQPKTMGYVGTADFMFDEFKFCNHCGAKMIGVEKLEFFERIPNVLEDREAHNND